MGRRSDQLDAWLQRSSKAVVIVIAVLLVLELIWIFCFTVFALWLRGV